MSRPSRSSEVVAGESEVGTEAGSVHVNQRRIHTDGQTSLREEQTDLDHSSQASPSRDAQQGLLLLLFRTFTP